MRKNYLICGARFLMKKCPFCKNELIDASNIEFRFITDDIVSLACLKRNSDNIPEYYITSVANVGWIFGYHITSYFVINQTLIRKDGKLVCDFDYQFNFESENLLEKIKTYILYN